MSCEPCKILTRREPREFGQHGREMCLKGDIAGNVGATGGQARTDVFRCLLEGPIL